MAQSCTFSGKIYQLKCDGEGDKCRVNFNIGTRKRYVSDEDKEAGKTLVFVPMVAFGGQAEFINKHFKDGDAIDCVDCEYTTREGEKDGVKTYFHNFRVGRVEFPANGSGGGEDNGGGKPSGGKAPARSAAKSSGSKRPSKTEDDDLPF